MGEFRINKGSHALASVATIDGNNRWQHQTATSDGYIKYLNIYALPGVVREHRIVPRDLQPRGEVLRATLFGLPLWCCLIVCGCSEASSSTRVGQAIAIRPSGKRPAAGWPMILLLHGYGDSNLSYVDFARDWAELGFVAVAVPGSVPARNGHFLWSLESTEPTHQDLQAIIRSPLFGSLVNRDQVFLLGFSQGALHAMLLAAEQPDLYAGVVALSPGGSLADRLDPPPLNRNQRPGRIVFIHGTEEPPAPYVRIWSSACQSAGWKFDSKTHPGGHHFPEDWDEMQAKVATFLID